MIILARYEIKYPLAQSNAGVVYVVYDRHLHRVCTLKQCLGNRDQLVQAWKAVGQLRHPGLPPVLEIHESAGKFYVVMEYIEGTNLATFVQQRGPLPEAQVIFLSSPILDALEYLHTRLPPIVHGGINPQNIILTPQRQIRLTDWGIPSEYTPGFSPPETFIGRSEPCSDLYGLGATMYFALTGHGPSYTPIPLRQLVPTISESTEAAIMHALILDPVQRIKSASEMKWRLSYALSRTSHPTPDERNILAQYRRHRNEIDALTDPIVLFLLGFVNHIGTITLGELSRDINLPINETRSKLVPLLRGRFLHETKSGFAVTTRGVGLLEEVGFPAKPAPQIAPTKPQRVPSPEPEWAPWPERIPARTDMQPARMSTRRMTSLAIVMASGLICVLLSFGILVKGVVDRPTSIALGSITPSRRPSATATTFYFPPTWSPGTSTPTLTLTPMRTLPMPSPPLTPPIALPSECQNVRIAVLIDSEYGKDVVIIGAVYGFADVSIDRTLQYFQIEFHEGAQPPEESPGWHPIGAPWFSERGSRDQDDILAVWSAGHSDYAPHPGTYTLRIVVKYHTPKDGQMTFRLGEKCWARINLR